MSLVNLQGKKPNQLIKDMIIWAGAFFLAFVLYILIHGFVFETTVVNMSSMEYTLLSGQRLIIWKAGNMISKPRRGDIIAFIHQEDSRKGFIKLINPLPDPDEVDYIKRVIALPGEKIDIKEGMVFINGRKLNEPYVKGGLTDNKGAAFPKTVPYGKLFVMGDNRKISMDSREIGYVDINKIRGRAVFSIWPLNRFGLIH